jgi:acyl-CoA thioester hydrolase
VASRARSVLVPFDRETGRPRRLSEAERAFLIRYAGADGASPSGSAVPAGPSGAAVPAGPPGPSRPVVPDGG